MTLPRTVHDVASSGLEGLEVAATALSLVDGQAGRLVIAGHEVGDLAEAVGFGQAAALLVDGALPDPAERAAWDRALGAGRAEAFATLANLGDALALADPMAALRTAVAHLATRDDDRGDALRLIAAVPVFAAAWWRLRAGAAPIAPDPASDHAADYLRMVRGVAPAAPARRALDRYLVTVIDHGLNASTFTARVVASTASDLVSAVVAAIGALKGPLHGGAPGPVLDMLDAIAEPTAAAPWLAAELAAGRRIMGMGHRVYRVRDPRAEVLERAILELAAAEVAPARLALARAVEATAERLLAARHPTRPLRANVEFFTAVLLDAVGLPRELFSATFAMSRVAGWCAHVLEQRRTGRLIRPSSRYVGPLPRVSSRS